MRSLVTGHKGFIGGHLVQALYERGDHVCGFDKGDTWPDGHFDVVYHLAAEGKIQPEYDEAQLQDTLLSTYDALHKLDMDHFVFTSSGAVYGDGELPISTYGAFKLGAEGLVNAWRERTGKRVSILRLGNVVGPRCRGVIPDILLRLKENPESLTVFGDGSAEKHYAHITDVVAALLDPALGVSEVMPEDLISVREIVAHCIVEAGAKPTVSWGSEPRGWVGDIPTPKPWSVGAFAPVSMASHEAVKRAIKEVWEAMK